jgi:peptide/nickel transport system substrate-binding protein
VNSAKLTDIINAGDYELSSWGWYPDPDPSSCSYFTCDQRPPDGKTYGNNDAYYCNPSTTSCTRSSCRRPTRNARWDIVHQMQKIFYEDSPYAIMWYDPIFSAWRSDRFRGYIPQPQPNGDPLEGWGGISEVWLSLKPVAGSAGAGRADTKGISPVVWGSWRGHRLLVGLPDPRRRAAEEDVVEDR